MAAKTVILGNAEDGRKCGTKFIINPATGALELPADLRLEVIKALRGEARRCQLRAHRRLLSLYLSQLGLQARCAGAGMIGHFLRYLLKFTGERHDQSTAHINVQPL